MSKRLLKRLDKSLYVTPKRCPVCKGTSLTAFVLFEGRSKIDDSRYCKDCKKIVKVG